MATLYAEDGIVDFKVVIIKNYNEKAHIKNPINTRIVNFNNYYLHFDVRSRYVLCSDNDLYRCLRRCRRIEGDDQAIPLEKGHHY